MCRSESQWRAWRAWRRSGSSGGRCRSRIIWRFRNALAQQAPGWEVVTESGLQTRPGRFRIPDVAVYEQVEDVVFSRQTPILVVEVLTPGTRSEDTVRKLDEYRTAGAGHYWMVDREQRTLLALSNAGERWTEQVELTDDHPTATVDLMGCEVALDLSLLLA